MQVSMDSSSASKPKRSLVTDFREIHRKLHKYLNTPSLANDRVSQKLAFKEACAQVACDALTFGELQHASFQRIEELMLQHRQESPQVVHFLALVLHKAVSAPKGA
jgi:hypothetical protein